MGSSLDNSSVREGCLASSSGTMATTGCWLDLGGSFRVMVAWVYFHYLGRGFRCVWQW